MINDVRIDGEEFACMNVTAQFPGMNMRQCLLSIKCNGYLARVSVTATDEATLSQILDCFRVLK